eukprot:4540491-Pyramimonas_sp.AAC.1
MRTRRFHTDAELITYFSILAQEFELIQAVYLRVSSGLPPQFLTFSVLPCFRAHQSFAMSARSQVEVPASAKFSAACSQRLQERRAAVAAAVAKGSSGKSRSPK